MSGSLNPVLPSAMPNSVPDTAATPSASAPEHAPERATDLAWPLICLLTCCAALRIATMLGSGAGLHVDEAQYWDWSRELHWGYYSKPPVIALLIRMATSLAGDGLLGVRWLAMLCWLACSGLLWRLGVAMGSARAGLWAAGLFASTPAAGLLGLVATTDAPLMLSWSLAMLASWHALQASMRSSPRVSLHATGWWIAAGIAFGIGLLSKYTMAAFVLSWLLLAWRARSTAVWRGLAIALICGGAVLAPHLLWNASSGWTTLRHTADITATVEAAGQARALHAVAEYFAGQLLVMGPFLGLLGLACLMSFGLAWRSRSLLSQRAGGHRVGSASQAADAVGAAGLADAAGAAGEHAVSFRPPAPRALEFALACALPLLAVGAVQALRHPVQINWVAPVLLGLCMAAGLRARQWSLAWLWTGTALSLALITVVALGGDLLRFRPGAAASNAALQASSPNARPGKQPRWDAWSRMRHWDSALNALRPELAQWPDATVVATRRDLIAHARYSWRDLPRRPLAWPAIGLPSHHYEWQQAWSPPARPTAATLLLADDAALPPTPAGHAPPVLLQRIQQGRVTLTLWILRPL